MIVDKQPHVTNYLIKLKKDIYSLSHENSWGVNEGRKKNNEEMELKKTSQLLNIRTKAQRSAK